MSKFIDSFYELSTEEFQALQSSGTLYKLYPDAPLNALDFEHRKNQKLAKQLTALLIYNLSEELTADPEDLVNVLVRYEKELMSFLQWNEADELNLSEVLVEVYQQIEEDALNE
jgi:hypothetical protein